jgi:hypothetical protein
MAALSPAESLFLLKPNRTPACETVKVTLLSLLAQGIVRLEEQVTKRFIGTRKTVYVRLTERPLPALPAHAVSLLDQVRAAQADTGSMSDVVKRGGRPTDRASTASTAISSFRCCCRAASSRSVASCS